LSREYLTRLQRRGVRPGLERMFALTARLGNPERAFRSVLIGGSNGKGSTARALAAIARAADLRVGLFTSPHLISFNERIEVHGRPITDAELEELITEVEPAAEEVGATYFEVAAALAFVYFARKGVDLAVLEVGLGGRLDAVNVVDPELSIITALSLEHTDWLGPTLAHIAREKAGIMRSGKPVLTLAGPSAGLLSTEARRRGALLEAVSPRALQVSGYGVDFSLGRDRFFGALMGRHQAGNLSLAARAATHLGIGTEAVARGLREVRHQGRLEYRPRERLLLDGAHNPDGARALAGALDDYFPGSPKSLVFAVSRDKDVAGMARWLAPRFQRVWLTSYPGPRARPPEELSRFFPGARVEADPLRALARARRQPRPGGLTVVAGSLYLLGAILRSEAGLELEERTQ